MDEWTKDMRALWHRVTGALGWGIWQHHDTGTKPVEAPLTASGDGTLSIPGWHAVTTLEGRLVALTTSADAAALLAAVPDLLEPCLRPAGADAVEGAGLPLPSDAHEAGWKDGYAVGEAEAYGEARRVVEALLGALAAIPDPEVQGAVAAAREAWDDEVEEWPAHDGEADPFNAGPGDPRPVC